MFKDTEVMDSPMDGESNAEETANEAVGVSRPSMQKRSCRNIRCMLI